MSVLSPIEVVRAARRRPLRRRLMVLAALVVGVVAAFWLRVLGGDYEITFGDFWRIVGGAQIPGATFILMDSKLPRAVLGLLVGGAMGTGGALFQTTLRNPLASSDVVGVSSGASAAAVAGLVVWHLSGWPLDLLAVAGAVAAAMLVRALAGRTGGRRLVLAGVAVAAGLVAVIQYLFTRADVYDAQLALHWLTGSLSAADWPTIRVLAVVLVVLLPLTAYAVRAGRASELGDDVAASVGVGPWRTDAILLCGVLLTAVSVAAAGPLSFVPFMAGPIARALNGGRSTLVGAALVGATVVVLADYVGAYSLTGVDLPAGVVTGALGAPFLIWLLTTWKRSA